MCRVATLGVVSSADRVRLDIGATELGRDVVESTATTDLALRGSRAPIQTQDLAVVHVLMVTREMGLATDVYELSGVATRTLATREWCVPTQLTASRVATVLSATRATEFRVTTSTR